MSMETSSQQLACDDDNKDAAGMCHDFLASAEPENQRWGTKCARFSGANYIFWPVHPRSPVYMLVHNSVSHHHGTWQQAFRGYKKEPKMCRIRWTGTVRIWYKTGLSYSQTCTVCQAGNGISGSGGTTLIGETPSIPNEPPDAAGISPMLGAVL